MSTTDLVGRMLLMTKTHLGVKTEQKDDVRKKVVALCMACFHWQVKFSPFWKGGHPLPLP